MHEQRMAMSATWPANDNKDSTITPLVVFIPTRKYMHDAGPISRLNRQRDLR